MKIASVSVTVLSVVACLIPTSSLAGESRVIWKLKTNRWMERQLIEVSPDSNRIYTSDETGLYAVSPIGRLLWFSAGSGGGHAIDEGADGTIYTGVAQSVDPEIIRALNPDGSLKWAFVPPISWSLIAGPSVGPDGNVYAGQDFTNQGGLGAFSLDNAGALRWSNPGDPEFGATETSLNKSEIVFGQDWLYMGFVRLRSGGNPVTFAFTLEGQQLWQTGSGGLGALFHSFPRVDPQGRAIGTRGQTGVQAITPGGATAWLRYHPGYPNLMLMPAVDRTGNVYVADYLGVELWALDPNGATRWVRAREMGVGASAVGVSPDGALVVVCGSTGGDGWVRGYRALDGALLWQEDLPREQGWRQRVNNLYPVFGNALRGGSLAPLQRKANAVFVTTRFGNVEEVPYGYLYAISIE